MNFLTSKIRTHYHWELMNLVSLTNPILRSMKMLNKIFSSSLIPILLFGALFNNAHADTAIDSGLDNTLGAIANVIANGVKQDGLDVLKDDISNGLSGVSITYTAVNMAAKSATAPVTLYIGFTDQKDSAGNPITTDIYFQDTYNDIKTEDLSLTDPALIQSVAQDSLEFLLRLSVRNVYSSNISKYHLKNFAQFIFTTIQITSQKNPNIYSLSQPLLNLSNALAADNAPSQLQSSMSNYTVRLTNMYKVKTMGGVKPKDDPSPSASDPSGPALSAFLRIVADTLIALQNDGPNTAKFFNDLMSEVNTAAAGTIPTLTALTTAISNYGNSSVVATVQSDINTLWNSINNVKSSQAQTDLLQLVNTLATLNQNLSDPSQIAYKLASLMDTFGQLLNAVATATGV